MSFNNPRGGNPPGVKVGNQTQTNQRQLKLQRIDNVFHRVMIALERLEIHLEMIRTDKYSLKTTAAGTERDLHDDRANPPTSDSFHDELELQCTGLYQIFETNDMFNQKEQVDAQKYFLENLLTWYGGRSAEIPPDTVERWFLPIASALLRSHEKATGVSEVVKKYVIDLGDRFSKLADVEKEKIILSTFSQVVSSLEKTNRAEEAYLKSGDARKPSNFTVHSRGTKEEGYRRLLGYFEKEFTNDRGPVDFLKKAVAKHLPDLKA